MGKLDEIYARLPVSAQHAAVSAFGLYWYRLRFSGSFHKSFRAYKCREKYTRKQWSDYQRQKLKELLGPAAHSVPFYRALWSEGQKRAAAAGALDELPLLEKDPIRSDPTRFLREDMQPDPKLTFHTSGSTGTPIASIWDVSEFRDSVAVREARSLNWAGVSYTLPRATFSGRMVEPDPASRGPFYRYNLVERQVYLSPFHLREETAARYVDALNRHGVVWLTGYAVSFYLLARFMADLRIAPPPSLKAVITTSEKLTPEMREVMESAYGCRVWEEYSTVENSLFVSECEHGKLHSSPDVAVIEILRPDGSACDPGEAGEVVSTCLMRHYQPFVRYRLGDVAMWDSEECKCGREMPVIKEVCGRIEDIVVGPDGRQMVRFHGVFVDLPAVQEGQVVQLALDQIRVKVVPSGLFCEESRQEIVRRIQQRLGQNVSVEIDLVESIPRTTAGKFQAVVSMLKREGT